MKHRIDRIVTAMAAAGLVVAVTACGDSTGPDGTAGTTGATTLSFRAVTDGASPSVSPGDVAFSHTGDPEAPTISVEGTNGELTLASIHFILAEFELDRADVEADCDLDEDACEEFEAPMQFLELPLTGEDAVAVRHDVPAGLYDELEFEIEDLEDDEEDEDAAAIEALLAEIRDQFPDWPRKGSVRIHGTFMPKDGEGNLLTDQARDFTVLFEAEVEIEKAFASPVEITETEQSITVVVDPRIWFQRGDGTVADLSQFDFNPDTGTPVPELEVEIETSVDEAIVEIEIQS